MSRVMKPVPASRPAEPASPPSHPLAGTTMSGADAILQVLADEGVDAIFGYSGGAGSGDGREAGTGFITRDIDAPSGPEGHPAL